MKGPKDLPKVPVPKVSVAPVAPQPTQTDDLIPSPTSPRGNNQKPPISPRGHTKVQSAGSSTSTFQSTVISTQQGPSQSAPRLGLVRAATANPSGHAKTGALVVPQPIQSSMDSPKSSSAPANFTYLEYDLHAVVDVANQFIGLALQSLTQDVGF